MTINTSRILIKFYKINNFPTKWFEKIQITGCNDASSFCVNHASNLHETPMLDLHPHYRQYVESKLFYNFKGQTNIYFVKVAPNVNIVKLKNESSFPAGVGRRKFE